MSSISGRTAFLFDLDGVIVDTARFHFIAWRKLANNLGFDFSEEQNEALKGVSRRESLLKIANWGGIALSESEIASLMELKNNWYLDLIETLTPKDILYDSDKFIADAKSIGVLIGLGSASRNAIHILERIGMKELFDTIVDGNNVRVSKPDPEVFLRGAENLEVEPARCLVFEDSVSGLQAANLAGMKSIGIGDVASLRIANLVVSDLRHLNINELIALI